MSKNTLVTIIIILVVLVAVSLYFVNSKGPVQDNSGYASTQSTVTPSPTDTSTPSPTPSAVTSGAVKSFVVEGKNFSFSPSTITVNKGDTVKITLDNTGGYHDLKIDAFNVATKRINGGAQDSVQFVADKTGSFEYYCSVGEHRQMGMKGTLIVK